jgi:TM2 domain-containing membrane protein YozV
MRSPPQDDCGHRRDRGEYWRMSSTDMSPMGMTSTELPGADRPSGRSRGVALALATILGPFGGHRFYVGKTGTGVLMALTLGGAGLWWIYDLILVASGSFRDVNDRLVTRWDVEVTAPEGVPPDILDELDLLRQQVAELAERVDFTERLLAAPREMPAPTHPVRPA